MPPLPPPLLDEAARIWCEAQFAGLLAEPTLFQRREPPRVYDTPVAADRHGKIQLWFDLKAGSVLECIAYVVNASGRSLGYDRDTARLRQELLQLPSVRDRSGTHNGGAILVPFSS